MDEEGLDVAIPLDGEGVPGSKGLPLDLNAIILTLIGSGGIAVGLIQVLKSYVERKPSLHIEIVRTDGKKFLLTAENLSQKQQHETMGSVETFLKS